jgi:hypothetical protein
MPGLLLVVENRPVVPVQKAPMNVRAIAGSAGFGQGRKAHPMPHSKRDRLGEFSGNHGIIGGPQSERWRHSDLELLRPEFSQE